MYKALEEHSLTDSGKWCIQRHIKFNKTEAYHNEYSTLRSLYGKIPAVFCKQSS
jgi:hypothetical protein